MQKNNERHKYVLLIHLFAYLAAGCILAGCAELGTAHANAQKRPAGREPAAGIEKAQAMEIAADVLARMHFVIDKKDLDAGYIRTRPLEGAQFFEFWRRDNTGFENWLYGNLHSIRRTVEINVSRQESELEIACNVQVERLSLPEQPVTSSARAYGMFSLSTPIMQTLRLNPEQASEMTWIDLGNDTKLETEIIKRITHRTNHAD